jgi:hypothetical protein
MSANHKLKFKNKLDIAPHIQEHIVIIFENTDRIENICDTYKNGQIAVIKTINLIRQLKNALEELLEIPASPNNLNNKAYYHDIHCKASHILQDLIDHKQKMRAPESQDSTAHLIHELSEKIIIAAGAFLSHC